MPKRRPATVDEYIQNAPREAQVMLRELRAILETVAPKARQTIKWGMPMFEEKRVLFAFAAYAKHLNFIPAPAALEPFKKELVGYDTGTGTVQFPYGKPLPVELIRKIAEFRAKQVREKDARWM